MIGDLLKTFCDSHAQKIPKVWLGSKHEGFIKLNNQTKGKSGVFLVSEYLKSLGNECRIVSDKGDLEYRLNDKNKWIKAEVKTATAKLTNSSESLWFNQVRVKQDGWTQLFLVGVYPDHFRIWSKERGEFVQNMHTLTSVNVLSHIGQGEDPALKGVKLLRNSKKDNFNEWRLDYSSKETQ
jgi:hypothetical protein